VATDLDVLQVAASTCVRCGLADTRTQVVFGSGRPHADLLLLGEAPGADEDRLGQPFVGRSGQLLVRLLGEELGLGRDDVYIANIAKCRPPDNRNPTRAEAESCRPWLDGQLDAVAPRVVVTFGNVPTQAMLGIRDGITKVRGSTYTVDGRRVVPTLHPAYVLRGGAAPMALLRTDLQRAGAELSAARSQAATG